GENDQAATALVDRLEKSAAADPEAAASARQLKQILLQNRERHSKILETLQFQDLTAQQIQYVGSLLDKIENELLGLAQAFDLDYGKQLDKKPDQTFHAGATYTPAGDKQPEVDSLVEEMKKQNETEQQE
ncbi:MAG: hypothetical protein L0922_06490, partial [Candidatus Mariimomonas ferrooxydans]